MINSKVNGNDHITTLYTKFSKNTSIIFKVHHNLNKFTVSLLYLSLIQPYIDYCNIILVKGHSKNLERLFRNQTKNSSCYYFAKWNAHTNPLFKHLNILIVYDNNKLQTLCLVYKAVNNLLPKHFNKFLMLI